MIDNNKILHGLLLNEMIRNFESQNAFMKQQISEGKISIKTGNGEERITKEQALKRINENKGKIEGKKQEMERLGN